MKTIKYLILFVLLSTITFAQYHSTHTGAEIDAGIRPYKVYTALFSQSGTSNPTLSILENTAGITLSFIRQSTGFYLSTQVFYAYFNKITVNITSQYAAKELNGLFDYGDSGNLAIYCHFFNTTTLTDYVGTTVDGIAALLEIRVYP